MASLVKEAAPDEEKMAGWSRTGIRRKAAADLAGTTSGSAGGLATPDERDGGGSAAPLASIMLLSTGRIKRESRRLLEARRDAEDTSCAAGDDEHSFIETGMAADVGDSSPRVEVKPGSPRENVAGQGHQFPPWLLDPPQLVGSSAAATPAPAPAPASASASRQEGVGGESSTDCGQTDGPFLSRECPAAKKNYLPAASLDRSTQAVAAAAVAAAAAAAETAVEIVRPAAVGITFSSPAVGIAPPAAATAAIGISIPAVGVSPPAVGVSIPAVGIAPPNAWAESDMFLQGAAASASELLPPAPPATAPPPARRSPSRRKPPPRSRRKKGSKGLDCSVDGDSGHVVGRRLRTCSFEGGCSRRPSFGCAGDTRATRCASHKAAGQIDITSRRCAREGCTLIPSFRHEGGKGKGSKCCAAHRLPGMEKMRVCEAAKGCTRSPSFGFRGSKRMSCSLHKVEGMMNLNIGRCRGPECRLTPCFAIRGSPAAFCAKHKEPGMVNVVSKRCEDASCDRIPSYGWEGGATRASFCASHKAEGMVNVRHPRCANPDCRRQPVWGKAEAKTGVFCKEHKEADMVDVKNNYGQPKKKKARKA